MSADGTRARLIEVARRHGLDDAAVAELLAAALPKAPAATWAGFATFGGEDTLADSSTRTFGTGHDLDGPLPPPPEAPTEPAAAAERYRDLGPLGEGGMGEVRRVWDNVLERAMAMKLIRPELLGNPRTLDRFLREARVTAQLQHPAIVPVHDLGRLPDGRVFFTMKEIRGRTLLDVIKERHAPGAETSWTLRRLIDALRRCCEAVAFAHDRGVLHRDIKPANIMLGEYGEVLLLDWGLARAQGPVDAPDQLSGELPEAAGVTRVGGVGGTPAYMPPEQAEGDPAAITAAADVYALGSTLYHLLCGVAPFDGAAHSALAALLLGPPPPVDQRRPDAPPMPEELVAVCTRAMARAPEDRYPNAGALAVELTAWLDGARKRERALAVVDEARDLLPRVAELRARAAAARAQAEGALAGIAPHQPVSDKRAAWGLLDDAAELERAADLAEVKATQLLRAALTHAPELPEAHALLADHYHAQHVQAEAARDTPAARRSELLLRDHDRGRYRDYLSGEGTLTLLTDPPGAEARLLRYEEQDRRLVPVFQRTLGVTPLVDAPLAMGSYLVELQMPGRAPVRYPVHLARQERWDGVRPGDSAPTPIALPPEGALGPDDVYVPAGWFRSGAVGLHNSLPPRRIWVDAFVIGRHPVTNADYIAFLDDLVADGREAEALQHAPRERAARPGELGALCYGRRDDGRFYLAPDAEGDTWGADWPVFHVTWHGAMAYCAWRSAQDGHPWRLPSELEWEKAARGVDGRTYPFGDFVDPTWARTKRSTAGPLLPASVHDFPLDESPYGVCGMAGNMADWCLELARAAGPEVRGGLLEIDPSADADPLRARVARGGTWSFNETWCAVAMRQSLIAADRLSHIGFRVARPWPVHETRT
ncbi:MAG: SUMF1/EgtB/PvdO family nonheme iron enzyme [Alphaproteobacteria bacterium]|nr:SUMF1/EgtB/PvdO family nonheme iron enzyme [Alphaproteobacteria bacterium]